MSIVAPKDTLAYQLKGRPLSVARDMSMASVKEVGAIMNAYMDKTGRVTPENEAIKFYYLNHAVKDVRKVVDLYEPLGRYSVVLELYNHQCSSLAARMFYYLLLICTRESRHVKANETSTVMKHVAKEYGEELVDFNLKLHGKGSDGAASYFRSNLPNVKLGPYVLALRHIFYHGAFQSSFGGPAWGAVCDCLVDFVVGKTSAEMMLDTSFTLAHNNGPIFNKGMLFDTYNSSNLIRILDVQRSGQIPQLVNDGGISSSYLDKVVVEAHKSFKTLFGDKSDFSGHMDWFKVEALGAVHSYPNDKAKQVAKYGKPAWVAEFEAKAAYEAAIKMKEQEEAKAKEALKDAMDAVEFEKKFFEVVPGLAFEKVERVE